MTQQSIELKLDDGVATITLAQPTRGNPFDEKFCVELNRIATECSINPQVRAVLNLGGSQQFSVAMDPKLNLAVVADQTNNRVLLVPLPH